jgi:hypothetical protein
MIGERAAGSADLGTHGAVQQRDTEIATGGHDLGCMPAAETGAVLTEGTVAHIVSRLDRPMTTNEGEYADGAGGW